MCAWARATSRTWFHEATQPRLVQCPIEVGDLLTKDRLKDPVVKLRKTSPRASSRKTPAPCIFRLRLSAPRNQRSRRGAFFVHRTAVQHLTSGSSHDYDSVTWYDSMNFRSVNHLPQTSCRGYRRAHYRPYMHRSSETPGVAPRIADCGGHAAQESSSQAQNQPRTIPWA
ncbi:hypothetical protein MRX96_007988 [Rhipicephalus microplus]